MANDAQCPQGAGLLRVTRLAPSPTGALHLGNARTFLINWVLARQNGWHIEFRVDDLESPRVKSGADAMALEDLYWLGLDWDGDVVYQSRRAANYIDALTKLASADLLYRCDCTRRQVEADSLLIGADGSHIYPGTCHGRRLEDPEAAIRFRVPDRVVSFVDRFFGPQQFDATRQLGDFVIVKAGGEWGYQLATVVDDAEAGVTDVVRGEDLLASTPRQMLLYEALGLSDKIPRYTHLPLVVGPDGRKLAKRHGDTRLRALRDEGVTAGRIRAMLARWSGFEPRGDECDLAEWLDRFSLDKLPREKVVYDDATSRPAAR